MHIKRPATWQIHHRKLHAVVRKTAHEGGNNVGKLVGLKFTLWKSHGNGTQLRRPYRGMNAQSMLWKLSCEKATFFLDVLTMMTVSTCWQTARQIAKQVYHWQAFQQLAMINTLLHCRAVPVYLYPRVYPTWPDSYPQVQVGSGRIDVLQVGYGYIIYGYRYT